MAHLPSPIEVAMSLTKTLRREVNVTPTAARNNLLRFFGLYSPASDAPAFVCVEADLAFAAFAGSAFSMIPADAARDCIKEKDLGEFVQDNFGEVLNILSRLFSHQDMTRVTLTGKVFPPAKLDEGLQKAWAASTAKLDLEVEIDGYGKGYLALRLI